MVEEIVNQLNKNKEKFIRKYHSGDAWQRAWTVELKKLLKDIAVKNNLDIAANGIEDNNGGEYLYDVVLYEMHPENEDVNKLKFMKSIKLALESEISQMTLGGLKVDFDKLFAANAELKVFVTIEKSKEDNVFFKFIEYARRAVKNFEGAENFYMIKWKEWDLKSSGLNFELVDLTL